MIREGNGQWVDGVGVEGYGHWMGGVWAQGAGWKWFDIVGEG